MKKITNKYEYDNLIKVINENLEWFNHYHFDNKLFCLKLENGDFLKLAFEPKNLAHLLGIDTDYLKSTGLFNNKSYDILKQMCNNSHKLFSMIQDGHLTYKNFISDFAFEKANNFKNICGINLTNIEFICKYSKENSFITGQNQLEGDYYIAFKADNGLSIIGLKKNKDLYFPMTNRYISFDEEQNMNFLNTLLTKQNVTLPTYLSIYYLDTGNYSKKIFLKFETKAKKLKSIRNHMNKYNFNIDVSDGYNFLVDKLTALFNNRSTMYSILDTLREEMDKKDLVDIEKLQNNVFINNQLEQLLTSYNKLMEEIKSKNNSNEVYINELKEVKEELLKHQEIIKNLQEDNCKQNKFSEKTRKIKKLFGL